LGRGKGSAFAPLAEGDAELLAHGAEEKTIEPALVAVDVCGVAEFGLCEDAFRVRKSELCGDKSLHLFSILLGLLGLSGFTGVATLVIQVARREVHVPTDAHQFVKRGVIVELRVLGGFLGEYSLWECMPPCMLRMLSGENRVKGGLEVGGGGVVTLHVGERVRDFVRMRKEEGVG
jgi:hypothetical protein